MELKHLHGILDGEDALVIGCGPSLAPWHIEAARWCWTFTCNRSVPMSQPDFGVCLERRADPIWPLLQEHRALFMFTHLDTHGNGHRPLPAPCKRHVNIGSKDVRTWFEEIGTRLHGDKLRLGQSAFYAAALAGLLGCARVGLLGVDLTEDRYPDVRRENEAWARLDLLLRNRGTVLLNLNPTSRLTVLEQGTLDDIQLKGCTTTSTSTASR